MADQHFPLIQYEAKDSPRTRGKKHGEAFREGIYDLAQIRRQLMLDRTPTIKSLLDSLAIEQLEHTKRMTPHIAEEMLGIGEGSGLSITDLVILNNYTDFRDIDPLAPPRNDGCSTVAVFDQEMIAGQTWDMHGSAKNYVCAISVPRTQNEPAMLLYSLVGCVALMGYTEHGAMIGVNNLNTTDARAGVIWPALVRKALLGKKLSDLVHTLKTESVTSAHHYLAATLEGAESWEITPTAKGCSGRLEKSGRLFHTNPCLAKEAMKVEKASGITSTTRERYALLDKKMKSTSKMHGVYDLLTDHEGYPKSICSHYQADMLDPSMTCGGAVGDLTKKTILMWRGCPVLDSHYVSRAFSFDENKKSFIETQVLNGPQKAKPAWMQK